MELALATMRRRQEDDQSRLEPVRRQRRVDRGAGDRPMAKQRWIALVSWPLLARA
jgi:hypothetical protein